MLRVTAHDEPRVLSFRLEGRLEGPWVEELAKCWVGAVAREGTPRLRVDLTGVTFVDGAGMAQLTAMHREGAEFVAEDCLTKAIVAEIVENAADGAASGTRRQTRGDGVGRMRSRASPSRRLRERGRSR